MARKAKRKARAARELNAKQVEQRLLATSFPRLHMMLILSLAALSTFLSSALLVRCGLASMGVRYALAVVGGYLAFLSLVRVWIAYQTRNWSFGRREPEAKHSFDDHVDLPDLSALGDPAFSSESAFSGAEGALGGGGGGGSFGGGGGADSFDVDVVAGASDIGASDALEAVGDAD